MSAHSDPLTFLREIGKLFWAAVLVGTNSENLVDGRRGVMRVQCPSCQRWVRLGPQVAEKFAGRSVKCPGCTGLIQVPVVAPAELAAADTAPPSSPAPDASRGSGIGILPVVSHLRPQTPPAERVAEVAAGALAHPSSAGPGEASVPQPAGPGDSAPAAFAGIAITASQPRGRTQREPKQREPKASSSRWRELAANRRVQIAVGGGTLAIVSLVVLAVWLFAGGEKQTARQVAKKQPVRAGRRQNQALHRATATVQGSSSSRPTTKLAATWPSTSTGRRSLSRPGGARSQTRPGHARNRAPPARL